MSFPLALLVISSLNYCNSCLIFFSVFRFQLLGSPWLGFNEPLKLYAKKPENIEYVDVGAMLYILLELSAIAFIIF